MNKLLLISGLLIGGVSADVDSTVLTENTKFERLNYFVNHMDDYNDFRAQNGYGPTSIEYIKTVPITTALGESLDGRLLKFNEGYILFGEDNMIHKMSYTNDINIVRTGNIEFYDAGGFYERENATSSILDDSNSIVPLEILETTDNTASTNSTTDSEGHIIYNGQRRPGRGAIYNPDAYVLDRYGSGFNMLASRTIQTPYNNYEPALISMHLTAQYIKNIGVNAFIYDDINGLTVATMGCDFVEKSYELKYGRALAHNYDAQTEEPNVYQEMWNNNWTPRPSQLTLPGIALRKHAYQEYGSMMGLTYNRTKELIKWFCAENNWAVTVNETSRKLSNQAAPVMLAHLNKNRMMLMCVEESLTYTPYFQMVAVGYRLYRKVVLTALGTTITYTCVLVEVHDTLYDDPMFYDAYEPAEYVTVASLVTTPTK